VRHFHYQYRQPEPLNKRESGLVVGILAIMGAAGGAIYGGIAANQSAQKEAALERQQGDIAMNEARINASNEAYNQTQAVQRQRLAFLANGVSLEGSPTMVLEQSKTYGQSQVDAILRQGAARKSLAYAGGKITQDKGRAALIGGYIKGASTVAGGVGSAYNAGAFSSTGSAPASYGPGTNLAG